MILLVVIASILIALVAIYQYNEQTDEYHEARLERKEEAIKKSIDIELQRRTTWPVEEKWLRAIFKERIFDISDVNNLKIDIYNLEGKLQVSSAPDFTRDTTNNDIPTSILTQLEN